MWWPPVPRLVVFDVGQGDSALVQGRGAAILVDGGGAWESWNAGRAQVLPALDALGVSRLDLVVATHADLDHRGGLPAILSELEVGELWLPAGREHERAFEAVHRAARARGVSVRAVGRGSPLRRFGDLRVEPLWPPREIFAARNAASLVVRVQVAAGRSVLFPGDLDAASEARLVASEASLAADVLLLPHHGSRGSGSGDWLDAVAPRLALVSAGCRNRFGMPHRELLDRLTARGLDPPWTGRDGALRVRLTGELAWRGTGPTYHCP